MQVKYSISRKRYKHAGVYEIWLAIAYANLNIVLASIIRNLPLDVLNPHGAGLADANETIEHPNCYYQSAPTRDAAGNDHDAHYDMFMYKPDMEALENNMS